MQGEMDEIEQVLQPLIDSGEIVSSFSIVGRYDPNRIRVDATLADWSQRDRSQREIVDSLRDPLKEIPGSRASARGQSSLNVGGGGGDRIEVALTGSNYDRIYRSALKLSEAIDTRSDILSQSEISYQPTQPQLSVQIDRERAADLGIDLDDLAATLRAMVGGDEVVDLNVDDQAIPILLSSETVSVANPADLGNLFVRTESGGLVPLSTVASIREEGIAAELDRTEQRRAIEVEADIDPEGTPLAGRGRRRSSGWRTESGGGRYRHDPAGRCGDAWRKRRAIVLLTYLFALRDRVPGAGGAVRKPDERAGGAADRAVRARRRRSWRCSLSGISLNIYSQIGLVMLIGLMAKNGILIVEFADQLRLEGRSLRRGRGGGGGHPPAADRDDADLDRGRGGAADPRVSGAGAEARQSIGWVIFGGLGHGRGVHPVPDAGDLSSDRAVQQAADAGPVSLARGTGRSA